MKRISKTLSHMGHQWARCSLSPCFNIWLKFVTLRNPFNMAPTTKNHIPLPKLFNCHLQSSQLMQCYIKVQYYECKEIWMEAMTWRNNSTLLCMLYDKCNQKKMRSWNISHWNFALSWIYHLIWNVKMWDCTNVKECSKDTELSCGAWKITGR